MASEAVEKSAKQMILFILLGVLAYADPTKPVAPVLLPEDHEVITQLASLTLPQQAENIRKKVKIELVKSGRKNGAHFFDFLGASKRSVEEIADIEGLYGKAQCSTLTSKAKIILADDAPPTLLLHEYIHVLQMARAPRWCEFEGKVLEPTEKREQAILYHRFEFETLKSILDVSDKLTMNFEDNLIVLEGLLREHKTLMAAGQGGLDDRTLQKVLRSLEVSHSQINYLTWLKKSPEDAGSVLQKMEVLNLKGCVQSSEDGPLIKRVNACVERRCALSKIKCTDIALQDVPEGEMNDLLYLVVAAWTKPRLDSPTCTTAKLRDEFIDHLQEPSPCWKSWFSARHKSKELKLESLNVNQLKGQYKVPHLGVDQEISFQRISNPETFIQKAYCYFVFQKAAGYGSIPIDQFAYANQGAVISYDRISSYQKWLADKEGQTCSQLVELFTGEEAARFDSINESRKYMLIINPLAALAGGVKDEKNLVATDINHERLHIVFGENKKLRSEIKEEWAALTDEERGQFKVRFPRYDFSNEEIALREYFSYTRQEHPEKAF